MPNYPCLDCGELSNRTRCLQHTRTEDARRVAKRGDLYHGDHPRRAKAQVADEPWCAWCGSEVDLVADHIVPGDRGSQLRTLCRSCNSRRAGLGRARKA